MAEIVFQNISATPSIAAAETGQYKLLYSPGTKNTVALDGFISDFRCFATIRSVAEMVNLSPIPTEQKPYYSESEIEQYQYGLLGAANVKSLQIHTSRGLTAEKEYKFALPLFNRKPHHEIDIHSRFTKNAYFQVSAGLHIWGKIDGLTGTDILTFWISAYEEGSLDISDIGMLKEDFYTLQLQADTVTTFNFPNGTQGYSFKCRADVAQSGIAWAWQESSLTNNYDYLPAFSEESAWIFPSLNRALFLKPESNCTLIVKLWRQQ